MGTLNHILSGCKIALAQGRYKWRHDKVLHELALSVEKQVVVNSSVMATGRKVIHFVKEGQKKEQEGQKHNESYLSSAKDWKVSVDLDKKLKIPAEITLTNLRPDMILVSKSSRQLGVVELTVPNEDRIEVSGELKRAKYEKIACEGRQKGWKVRIWAVEVGSRGFPAASMVSFLKEIGMNGSQRRKSLEKIGQTAEEASYTIWKAGKYRE